MTTINSLSNQTLEEQQWSRSNQQYLMVELDRIRLLLERFRHEQEPPDRVDAQQISLQTIRKGMQTPPAIDTLCDLFGLTPFERDVLLLCAGMELDHRFASLCTSAHQEAHKQYPTIRLALAVFPEAHWTALIPTAPLRRWRFIEVGSSEILTTSSLRIDERVLHYLTGIQYLDEHLIGFVKQEPMAALLAPSHQQIAEECAKTWTKIDKRWRLLVLHLCGENLSDQYTIASWACQCLGLNLYSLPISVLPTTPHELDSLMRLWEREAIFSGNALLIDVDELDRQDSTRVNAVNRFIEEINGALFLSSRDRRPARRRPLFTWEVGKPQAEEQRVFWREALGNSASQFNGQVEQVISQFDLSVPVIQSICAQVLSDCDSNIQKDRADSGRIENTLLKACRIQVRSQLENLAQRIEPIAQWDDLILPDSQKHILYEIAAHVRQRTKVYESWGFANKSTRGLGVSVLFSGNSGTGKTMASEVLANELQLDLYHIDLSQVVSKYIGETEKNLRKLFDAAEACGTILLFDEADALFGKRSEVKDSHDRYANIEVSYLLQRMEAYRGLAILTTNMKKSLDTAFLRRIRFIIQFPFPDHAARIEIWRRIFPDKTPREGLDVQKLAQLNVAGGTIRNIALNAAFQAADANEPVRMEHLLQAARTEYCKLEKSITSSEVNGWT